MLFQKRNGLISEGELLTWFTQRSLLLIFQISNLRPQTKYFILERLCLFLKSIFGILRIFASFRKITI